MRKIATLHKSSILYLKKIIKIWVKNAKIAQIEEGEAKRVPGHFMISNNFHL
jgi:hypothetical protein